jgi:hypothetical protein
MFESTSSAITSQVHLLEQSQGEETTNDKKIRNGDQPLDN